MQTIHLTLSDALPQIRDADLLLWRGTGWISSLGRGIHYHAATAAWWNDDLMVLDTHWRRGGDCRQLANDVHHESGVVDWFEANAVNDAAYDRDGVVRYMRRLLDTQYGFRNVGHAFCHHVPGVRRFINSEIDDDERSNFPPFCSEARSRADRIGGGCDPVPFASDRATEPSDLARSPFYRYRGTLVWDEGAIDKVRPPAAKPIFSVSTFALAT